MSLYYVKEPPTNPTDRQNALFKAREDVAEVLDSMGWKRVDMPVISPGIEGRLSDSIRWHRATYRNWKEQTRILQRGDLLLVQFPPRQHSIFLSYALRRLRKRGVTILFLCHDIDMLRGVYIPGRTRRAKFRIWMEEKSCLSYCHRLIAHNKRMAQLLTEQIGFPGDKITELEIFDYLIPAYTERAPRLYQEYRSCIVAGNLIPKKAGYLYDLPEGISVNLYGLGYSGRTSEYIRYHGAFLPEELPEVMEGGFGLVWDGDSADTCSGAFGAYLRYNNPHKLSLYLSSGIPVILWEEAAMADFVRRHECGITVASLHEIRDRLEGMTPEEYLMYKDHAEKVGERLRDGYYTRKAVGECAGPEHLVDRVS